jgi:hypothetical protein
MRSPLKIRFFQFLLLVCAVVLLASVAQAESSLKHHHHGEVELVSPFDKAGLEKPLHCVLNLHQHFQTLFCPHQRQEGKSNNLIFRADCGTHSGSANSSNVLFVQKHFKTTSSYQMAPTLFSRGLATLIGFKLQSLPRAIDLPPQLT